MNRVRSSISASILFHLFFALISAALWQRQLQSPKKVEPLWIDLEPVSPKSRDEAKVDDSKKQIVQTIPGRQVEQVPKNAFLGERTQTVDRETVSRNRTTVIGSARPSTATRTEGQDTPAAKKKTRSESATQIGNLGQLGLPVLSRTQNMTNEQFRAEAEKERNWVTGGAQLQDYVKGLKEGEQTALNTREFVFYGYFHRIRERLDKAWVPILRERLTKWFQSGRRLASAQEHATRVLVILNKAGEITRVQIVSDSGVQMLDDAAVQAFNRAGPFPNPPQALVDERGEIQVPWEFVLRT